MPSSITIIGLGYGDPYARSLAAQHAIDAADRIVLRTAIHEGIEDLINDSRVVACDDLYENADSFTDVYINVIDRVIDLAESDDIVFAVPGSPAYGEHSVRQLITAATELGHSVKIIGSPSGLESVALLMELDILSDQVQVLDAGWISERAALEPFSGGTFGIDPTRPVVIGQVYARHIASDVKHWLSRIFPEDHQVSIVRNAGIPGKSSLAAVQLCDLDHHGVDHLTTVVVMPLESLNAEKSPATLHRIIAQLRSENGCPWDRDQTHFTLKDKVIEEAHEVAEAIDNDDPDALAEELGDLLLLVALHAQIAEEEGSFTIEDIYGHVNTKLVRRHPHVFGDVVAETPGDVLSTWRDVKSQEKVVSPEITDLHRFYQLPKSMSVLQRIKRAESFEEHAARNVFEDIGESMLELVSGAMSLGVDPEAALEFSYRRSIENPAELRWPRKRRVR